MVKPKDPFVTYVEENADCDGLIEEDERNDLTPLYIKQERQAILNRFARIQVPLEVALLACIEVETLIRRELGRRQAAAYVAKYLDPAL